tara:strand:- start:114 stop:557 length:444 start_codon:yes stop_codon:yes gene_type:complete
MEKSNTIIYHDIETQNSEIDSLLMESEEYYNKNCLDLRKFIPKGHFSVIIMLNDIDEKLSYSISQNRKKLESCDVNDLKSSCMYNINNGTVHKDKILGLALFKPIIRNIMDQKGQMHLAPKMVDKNIDLISNCMILNFRTIKREFYD